MQIKFVKLGSRLMEMEVPAGTTLGDAIKYCLDDAEIIVQEFEIRLNGQRVEPTAELKEDDVVTAVPPICGGVQ